MEQEAGEEKRDSVAGRSIMGLVPPFGWKDVETFDDDVAYVYRVYVLSRFDVIFASLPARSKGQGQLITNFSKIYILDKHHNSCTYA